MFIIDRFEGDTVILEYEARIYTLPKRALPDDAKEGDVVHIEITIGQEQTKARRDKIKKLEDELFE